MMMYKILLVDDERWIRTSLKHVIEQTGLPFKVVQECKDGLSALDWLKEEEADLIMADIKMPVMDGVSFMEQLRLNGGKQDVIIISGYDDFSFAQAVIRSGVMDYLIKPVEMEDMKRCLQKWINKRPAAGESPKPVPQPVEEQSTVNRVIRCIHGSMPGHLTLKEAASKVYLNPSYLSQLFKKHTGKAFSDYVAEVRLEEAKGLLSRTTLLVSDISDRLGYTDMGHFSSSFKKYTGITPTEYRRQAVSSGGKR
jgi:YesN/AraC family two-component response regulator